MSELNNAIILAGGNGTRLQPLTNVTNKHFLPIYDKPMIYYSLSICLLFEIKNITLVCNKKDFENFKKLLGDGSEFGIAISYKIQASPEGIPHGIMTGLGNSSLNNFLVVLGDNFIYGTNFFSLYIDSIKHSDEVEIFTQEVSDPQNYGIAIYDNNKLKELIEKPKKKISNNAVIGLYKFKSNYQEVFNSIKKSSRGEFEIVDVLKNYNMNKIKSNKLGRGVTWFDMGTFENFYNCSSFVKTIQNRQNLMVASPHEISFNNKFINDNDLEKIIYKYKNSDYGKSISYLLK
jgi:glucose-1-phosphate thymidylyltransferase